MNPMIHRGDCVRATIRIQRAAVPPVEPGTIGFVGRAYPDFRGQAYAVHFGCIDQVILAYEQELELVPDMVQEQMDVISRALTQAMDDWEFSSSECHDSGDHAAAEDYANKISQTRRAMAALHAAWATMDAPTPSTPAAFRAALEAVGHNQTTFARHVDVAPRTVRCWAAGTPPAPRAIMLLLDHMRRAGQYGPVSRTPKPMPAASQG